MEIAKPPLPPFTTETAAKVQAAEDAWNSRDVERVALAYTVDSEWRNRNLFFSGREAIKTFLTAKWAKEHDYRLRKELWAFTGNRIAVRFEYEFHDDQGQWFRAYGNENWEFAANGLMQRRFASINDLAIDESARKLRWGARAMILPHTPFVPSEYWVKPATERWELREALRLRRQVFCDEQGLFEQHDRDEMDRVATTLVAVSGVFGMPEQVVGTVRICEPEPGHWQGSRLAVAPEYRRVAWLGSELIRLAVSTAHAHGATHFTAQVQAQNVLLFRRLHWVTLDECTVRGRPHHRMQADLAFYPPDATGCVIAALRQAA